MASAIGWYIHASRKGYVEHGITVHDKQFNKGFQTYATIKTEIQNRADRLTSITSQQQRDINDTLTYLAQNKNTITPKGSEQTIQKAIEEETRKQWEDKLQEINWDTFDVTLEHPQNWYVGRSALEPKKVVLNEEEMLNRLNRLEEALIARLGTDNNVSANVIKQAQDLKKAYESSIAKLKSAVRGNVNESKMNSLIKSGKHAKVLSELEQQRKELVNLITLYAAYPPLASQKGLLFELAVGHIGAAAQALGFGEIVSNVKQVGAKPEDITYNLEKFENLDSNSATYKALEKNGHLVVKGQSQGKVDVQFTWDQADIRASVKNYNLKSGHFIHLVSDSPLTYMLQNEDSDLINHFLNVCTTHVNAPVPPQFKQRKDDLFKSIKLILFYQALTADGLQNRSSANLFIVNDNATGKIHVYTMGQIMKKVIGELGSQSVQVDGKSIMNMTLIPNTWHLVNNNKHIRSMTAAQARVKAVLQELHKRKVSAALNIQTLLK